jgi:hypothetical protein
MVDASSSFDPSAKKFRASLSYRVAMRRKSLSLQKQRSMTFRPL